jgi:acyl carrier protein
MPLAQRSSEEEMNVALETGQPLITVDQAIAAVEEVMVKKSGGGRVPIDASTRFDDLQFDSLDVAELFVILEEAARTDLDPSSGEDVEAVSDLVRLRAL